MKRKLRVNLDDLAMAMGDRDRDVNRHYFDTETGEYILISAEVMDALESEDEEDDVLLGDLPEWQQEQVEQAEAVAAGLGGRYLDVPESESRDGFRLMEDFIETVEDAGAKRLLSFAIGGPKPFRRFKDALCEFPEVRQRWFEFETQAKRAAVREWLETLEIEAEDTSDERGAR